MLPSEEDHNYTTWKIIVIHRGMEERAELFVACMWRLLSIQEIVWIFVEIYCRQLFFPPFFSSHTSLKALPPLHLSIFDYI